VTFSNLSPLSTNNEILHVSTLLFLASAYYLTRSVKNICFLLPLEFNSDISTTEIMGYHGKTGTKEVTHIYLEYRKG
jgi:hypothetical protein